MYELEVFVSATLHMKSQINFVKTWEDNIEMDLQKVGGGCGD